MSVTKVLLIASICVMLANTQDFVARSFSDNMVLQQYPAVNKIYGWVNSTGLPQKITVLFATNTKLQTNSDKNGYWEIELPSFNGSFQRYGLEVSSSNGQYAEFGNIMFGNVYLCSGQSNMDFTLVKSFGYADAKKEAQSLQYVSFLKIPKKSMKKPTRYLPKITPDWTPATQSSPKFDDFSAVCWNFGVQVWKHTNIPVGLIQSSWGGTPIETWSSPEALRQCNSSKYNELVKGPKTPSNLWNAMIFPLLPVRVAGTLWYQGEGNTASVTSSELYACQQKSMIADWRKNFDSEFKFLFVQLGPWYKSGDNVPILRDSQLESLSIPGVAYGAAYDLGDPLSPYNVIHPRNKKEVGRRLFLAYKDLVSSEENNVAFQGPAVDRVEVNDGKVSLVFSNTLEAGLKKKIGKCPPNSLGTCSWFNLGTSSGDIVVKDFSIISNTSIALNVNQNIVNLTHVSYGWSSWPVPMLYDNKNDLPLVPFKLDVSQ
eukprot:TRINITY_DN7439_c0_g1_i1.p1 TRINITY_DN7439_c0_g1~~TRINITY_DN7439_c0_g1_i1.p1  ORF type:complete len:486 (-),score=73.93 TRINITY_DN7439_c0_g1_i1:28-1485(-)